MFFDLQPHPFQERILEKLTLVRTCRHYFKNLVIAATGKGKTVIASFDYQRCRRDNEEFQDHLSHGWGKGANKIKWYL